MRRHYARHTLAMPAEIVRQIVNAFVHFHKQLRDIFTHSTHI